MSLPNSQSIIEMARQKGAITPRDVRALGMAPENLNRLAKQGQLIRAGRGVYEHPEFDLTEMHSYVEVASAVPESVFCLLTALRIHEVGTQNDYKVWIAIPRKHRVPKTRTANLKVMRTSPDQYKSDVQFIEAEGVTMRIYSLERTIVDCFRLQRLVGLDVALEALRESLLQKRVTVGRLHEVAKRLRTDRVITPYIEAFLI